MYSTGYTYLIDYDYIEIIPVLVNAFDCVFKGKDLPFGLEIDPKNGTIYGSALTEYRAVVTITIIGERTLIRTVRISSNCNL